MSLINEETGELAISKKKLGPGHMGLNLLDISILWLETYVHTPPDPLLTAICMLDPVLEISRYPPLTPQPPHTRPPGPAPAPDGSKNSGEIDTKDVPGAIYFWLWNKPWAHFDL